MVVQGWQGENHFLMLFALLNMINSNTMGRKQHIRFIVLQLFTFINVYMDSISSFYQHKIYNSSHILHVGQSSQTFPGRLGTPCWSSLILPSQGGVLSSELAGCRGREEDLIGQASIALQLHEKFSTTRQRL